MSDPARLYLQSLEVFDDRVRHVGAHQWSAPTPCDQWDVRELVNHVTVEDLWAPQLLAGRTMEEVGAAFDGDQLGADPVAFWTAAAQAARQAASAPDVASRTVHLSYGDEAAGEYLLQLCTDHLIHAWDLARATGTDTELPAELVTACAAWFSGVEQLYRQAGVIGAAVPTSPDADPQTRLLAAFGRRTT